MNNSLENIISIALVTPKDDPNTPNCVWGLPLLLWGPPGIGKSDRVRAAGNAVGLEVRTVFPATRAPEDFSGAPFMVDGEVKVQCIIGGVNELVGIGKGVFFIDEVSCAVPAVQASLLGVVLDRRIGDTIFPPGVRIISAANPANEAAGGWDLTPPMANRFAHLDTACPTTEEWTDWLRGNASVVDDITAAENLVKENWGTSWARATALMAGFMRGGGLLFSIPQEGHADRGRAWPSPRSWTMAAHAVATCIALDVPQLSSTFVEMCVGKGQAIEWASWVKNANLPDPRQMCLSGWTPNKSRLDITVAALRSMSGYVAAQKSQKEREMLAVGAWKILEAVDKQGNLDVAAPCARELMNAGLGVMCQNKDVLAANRALITRLGATGLSGIFDPRRKK